MIPRVKVGPGTVAPRHVVEAITFVRNLGTANMLDTVQVRAELCRIGKPSAAVWIQHHKEEYAQGVFGGFTIEEDETR